MGMLGWIRGWTARDGQAEGLTAEALATGRALAGAASVSRNDMPETGDGSDRTAGSQGGRRAQGVTLDSSLAVKLLDGFLSNRRQTLIPHTLNLAVLSEDDAALVIEAMAAAVQADGLMDSAETQLVPSALRRIGAADRDMARFDAAMTAPQPLGTLTARIEAAGLGAHAYAAALLATNRRSRVNRAFLDYLGQRLGLTTEVTGGLQRRYRT